MFRFGFLRRQPLGMCFFADEAGGGGADGGGTDNGTTGAGRSDITNGGDGGTTTTNDFTLPDALKDKEYAKGAKGWDDITKKIDGYKNLAGKKAVPEYGKASDQDWEEYFSRTRPEGGKYALNEEGIFEGLRGNTEFTGALEGLFNKAGLTQKQVDILMDPKDGYPGLTTAQIAKLNGVMQEKEAAADNDYESRLTSLVGDRRDEALANALKVKEELGITNELTDLDPSQLASVTYAFDKFYKEYIANDDLTKRTNGDGGANTNDPIALQAALDKYKSDNWSVYSDTNHARYPEIMKNVQSMTDQILKISSLK